MEQFIFEQTPQAADEIASPIRARRPKARRSKSQKTPGGYTISLWDQLYDIHHCAIEDITSDMVADASVDAIITDPPYLEKHLPDYTTLAEFAARVLKPYGWCVVMTGVVYLPEVLMRLSSVLTYRWTIANIWPGGAMKCNPYEGLSQAWKPIVVFQNGDGRSLGPGKSRFPKWNQDLIVSSPKEYVPKNLKQHKWQQSEAVFGALVDRFTMPGELVVDPFAGSGTTGRAAVSQQRRFWGCDASDKCARQRVNGGGAAEVAA